MIADATISLIIVFMMYMYLYNNAYSNRFSAFPTSTQETFATISVLANLK